MRTRRSERTAVGTFSPRRHVTSGFSLHFDGSTWSLQPMPAGAQPWAVVAVGPNDAWAVGQLTGLTTQPLTEHWDGARWTSTAAPALTDADVWAVTARPGTSHTWATGTQTIVGPGVPLILERR